MWLLAASAVFYLIAVPPLQDAWAYFFWERVPCKVTMEDGKLRKFLFNYDVKDAQTGTVVNRGFNSIRKDFWNRKNRAVGTFSVPDTENFDRICYVAPGNPRFVVLELTAHKRWDHDSLFLSGFVICVATALTFASRIRRKKINLENQAP